MLNVLRDWLRRRQEIHHLGHLDDRLLADMGLGRELLEAQLSGQAPKIAVEGEKESRRRKDRQRRRATYMAGSSATATWPRPAVR